MSATKINIHPSSVSPGWPDERIVFIIERGDQNSSPKSKGVYLTVFFGNVKKNVLGLITE